jgi:quercetin dioxygenase-like cupin family protein
MNDVSTQEMRVKVQRLEEALLARPHLDVDALTTHRFADGLYSRQLVIPAGHCAVGKIHKREHFTFIMSGQVVVLTENGPVEMCGPCVLVTKPGTKRAVYAVTDSVWITVHVNPDNERDMDKLEQLHIAPTFGSLETQEHERLTQAGAA